MLLSNTTCRHFSYRSEQGLAPMSLHVFCLFSDVSHVLVGTIYIYKTVVCVCSHFIGHVSWRCTPRSTVVWRAGWPVAVDTRSLACGSSTKRGRSLKKKPGDSAHRSSPIQSLQRSDRLNVQNPGPPCFCPCGSFGNNSEPSLNVLLSRRKIVSPVAIAFQTFQEQNLSGQTTFGRAVVAIQLTDAGFRSFRDVKLREGRRAFFVGLPSVLHRSCDSDL